MTNSANNSDSRMVAPALHRVGNHPWAWTSITDLALVAQISVDELWQEYARDAHAAVLEESWNGQPWKFSVSCMQESSNKRKILDVWDMKTGTQVELSPAELQTVLFPAGWSRFKTKEGNELGKCLRAVLAVGEEWYPDSDADTRARSHGRSCALASPLMELKKSLVETIGKFSSLEFALKQIECCQDALEIDMAEELSESLIRLVVTKSTGGDHQTRKVTVNVKIRLVLGRLQVLEAHVGYPSWS